VDHFEKLKRGLTLVLRISYGGTKAWRVGFYIAGKPKAKTLGRYPEMGVKAAREAAFAFDPKAATAAAQAGSFKEVAELWLKRYVAAKGLRTQPEIGDRARSQNLHLPAMGTDAVLRYQTPRRE
jgi:hypothetical protein